MIKTYSLLGLEIDDVNLAVADIQAQMASVPLLRNTIGLLVCHYDFIESGVVKALCDLLPFPLIGITTFSQATDKGSGIFQLSITILTSDDVRFAHAYAQFDDTAADCQAMVGDTYRTAFDRYKTDPALLLSFMSANCAIAGDAYLRTVDALSANTPHFGALAAGEDEKGTNVFAICGNTLINNGFVMLLCIGPVVPRFFLGQYRLDKLMSITATVTGTQDNQITTLNGQPAVTYLAKHGFVLEDGEMDTVSSVPFMCRFPNEEAYTARTMIGFDPATGAMRFLGEIPEGSMFRIGSFASEDLLNIAYETAQRAIEESPDASVMLAFSCVGRYIMLGLSPTSEIDRIPEAIPEATPFLTCYVGGEICPVVAGSVLTNRYHNASLIICTLS